MSNETTPLPTDYVNVRVTITDLYLNTATSARPTFSGTMDMYAESASGLISLTPTTNPNTIKVTASGGTPVQTNFVLSSSTPSVYLYDNGTPISKDPVQLQYCLLVGFVVPMNNGADALGSKPYACEFITLANPSAFTINYTTSPLANGNTYSSSVTPASIGLLFVNTAKPGLLWQFGFYTYFYYKDPATSVEYSGTAYWDPYVDNENCHRAKPIA